MRGLMILIMNMTLDFGTARPAYMRDFRHMIISVIEKKIRRMIFVILSI
jgi:hypothetical protein